MRRVALVVLVLGSTLGEVRAQDVPDANVGKVIAVFLAMGCTINPLTHGDQAETAAGLTTLEFSKAMKVLETRGDVTMNEATLNFRLKHKDCPQ